MKRRLPYFISAALLSALLAAVLPSIDFSSPRASLRALVHAPEAAVPAVPPMLRRASQSPAEPLSASPTAPEGTSASVAVPVRFRTDRLPEVRVRATRDGRDYGWVQLPRGTRVELLHNEGKTLVVRYDQVTLRIPRRIAETGTVVVVNPPARPSGRLADL